MGLYTDPVTLNDGTSDHIFNFRAQLTEPNSIVGEWIEPASASAVDQKLTVKHTKSKSGTERHLLQISSNQLLADGVTYAPIVWNLTVAHETDHPDATVLLTGKLAVAAATDAALTNLTRGLI